MFGHRSRSRSSAATPSLTPSLTGPCRAGGTPRGGWARRSTSDGASSGTGSRKEECDLWRGTARHAGTPVVGPGLWRSRTSTALDTVVAVLSVGTTVRNSVRILASRPSMESIQTTASGSRGSTGRSTTWLGTCTSSYAFCFGRRGARDPPGRKISGTSSHTAIGSLRRSRATTGQVSERAS